MKRLALSMVFLSVVAMTGCALHIPGPFYHEDYYPVTVLLDIEPDDAEVYLDGRLIGKAYEFSTSSSSIRLSSHSHSLALRREGYYETVVDLENFRGRNIVLDQTLRSLAADGSEAVDASEPSEEIQPPVMGQDPAGTREEEPSAARYALTLKVEPPEATIYVNGRFWGIAPQNGQIGRIAFAEAEIKLDVFKPGFKPFSKKIPLTEKGEELTVKLEAEKR